jgi:predicted 3-demethylubiquinone-9 3-methyltransferase (glyoxalase superfamily)
MKTRITAELMFDGRADDAMRFYTSLFDDGAIEHIDRYVAGEEGKEGTVKHATFRIAGQTLGCIDTPIAQPFTFTPAMSLAVTCDHESALDDLFARLLEGGTVLVPLAAYPFSKRFGWLTDRFGVSWQLRLVAG